MNFTEWTNHILYDITDNSNTYQTVEHATLPMDIKYKLTEKKYTPCGCNREQVTQACYTV